MTPNRDTGVVLERVVDPGDDPCGVEGIDVSGTTLADGPLRAIGWGTVYTADHEDSYTGILWKRDSGEGPLFVLSPEDGSILVEGYLYHDARALMPGSFCFGCGGGFVRGDVDGNGSIFALVDALYLLDWAFVAGMDPPCRDAADVDDNGTVHALIDALRLLVWAFLGGLPPPAPYPECGFDSTGEFSDCATPPEHCDSSRALPPEHDGDPFDSTGRWLDLSASCAPVLRVATSAAWLTAPCATVGSGRRRR